MRRLARFGALALVSGALVTGIGCLGHGEDDSGGEDGDTGTAQVAISQVPSDGSVGCIAVTATGSFTVTESEDVSPGQSALLKLKGLPVGTVSFTGNAYQGQCAAVTPATIPTWISDPVLASVSNGAPVQVFLVMKKNGKANVDVDFPDDPACSADGAPCFSGAECCSQSCVAGSCQSEPPACAPGLTSCAGVCVDLSSDAGNCGGCGNVCPGGAACQNGVCMAPTCSDSTHNGTETDIDCGGVCPPCAAGKSCQGASDCQAGLCINGICAECQSALDCPATGNECEAALCAGGSCGVTYVPAGTPLSTQSVGDCNVYQCNGSGSFWETADFNDIPNDGNDCTVDTCSPGGPTFTPVPAGTPCNQNGGSVCDGAGSCI